MHHKNELETMTTLRRAEDGAGSRSTCAQDLARTKPIVHLASAIYSELNQWEREDTMSGPARCVRSGATTGRIPATDRRPIGRQYVSEPANSCGAQDETPANTMESADAEFLMSL